jgi:hypothetical protein
MKRLICGTLLALAGCGGDSGGGDVVMAEGDQHYYVMNQLTVPMEKKDYSIDLNGDGRPDNQLGNIIGALSAQNLDTQMAVNDAVKGGSVLLLISVQATSLTDANNVGVTVYLGTKNTMPDFTSGMGMFSIDSSQAPAKFFGKIATSKMLSNNPVTTKSPVIIALKLPLIAGVDPITLKLNGGHIQFKTGTDMASGKPGLIEGQLHGSIKNDDVQNTIIPAVAMLLTKKIADDCMGGGADGGAGDGGAGGCTNTAMQIKSIFDTGGCGTAKASDGIIETCEVAMNSIIMNVLSPDIQVFDSAGNYAPNKDNTKKDSLSLGLSFTAVQSGKF